MQRIDVLGERPVTARFWRERGKAHFTLLTHPWRCLVLCARHLYGAPSQAARGKIREVVAVFDVHADHMIADFDLAEFHRRPDLLHREVAAFLFVVRADDAIRRRISHVVYATVPVGPLDAFIRERPEKTAGDRGTAAHDVPVVAQARADATVVESVQKLGGHEDVGTRAQPDRAVVVLVVIGVDAAVNRPRMQYRPPLRIPTIELAVVLAIPATFIAVVPEENAGVIHIAPHDLSDEPRTRGRVVEALPAGQFIEHVET